MENARRGKWIRGIKSRIKLKKSLKRNKKNKKVNEETSLGDKVME